MNKKFEKLAHSVNKAAQRILPLFIVLGGGYNVCSLRR